MKLKRLICALLVIVLVFSCSTTSAFAVENKNDFEINSYDKTISTTIKSNDWTKVIYSSNMARSDTITITLNNDGNSTQQYTIRYKIVEHMAAPDVDDIVTTYNIKEGNSKTHTLNTTGNNFTIYAKYYTAGITGTIESRIMLYQSV